MDICCMKGCPNICLVDPIPQLVKQHKAPFHQHVLALRRFMMCNTHASALPLLTGMVYACIIEELAAKHGPALAIKYDCKFREEISSLYSLQEYGRNSDKIKAAFQVPGQRLLDDLINQTRLSNREDPVIKPRSKGKGEAPTTTQTPNAQNGKGKKGRGKAEPARETRPGTPTAAREPSAPAPPPPKRAKADAPRVDAP